jgi:hypothetical protein
VLFSQAQFLAELLASEADVLSQEANFLPRQLRRFQYESLGNDLHQFVDLRKNWSQTSALAALEQLHPMKSYVGQATFDKEVISTNNCGSLFASAAHLSPAFNDRSAFIQQL